MKNLKVILVFFLVFAMSSAQVPVQQPYNAVIPTSNITALEYYVGDVDPGFGNGTAITIPTGLQDATVTNTILTLPASLASGLQNIHFRSEDPGGFPERWSITNHKAFVNGTYSYPTAIPTSNITALEYYVGDVDPGFGNGIAMTIPTGLQDATVTNITLTLPASLASGIQNIHFRSEDPGGFPERWSITNNKLFVVDFGSYSYPSVIQTSNVVALEYFVGNADSGFGNTTPITIPVGLQNATATNVTLTLPTSLVSGTQNIYFRSVDEGGLFASNRWSMTNSKQFTVGTLSIPEFDIANLKVFPNPFYDELSIKYDKELTKISVINFLGQEILTLTNNSLETKLNLSGLSSGTYFLQLNADNTLKTVKVIKK